MPSLRYLHNGQEHWASLKEATVIARADINDICVDATSLSRQQAIISVIGNEWTVAALGSSNSIEINGLFLKKRS